MRILLTGANGYIGTRLLPVLQAAGHEVFLLVRDPRRLKEDNIPALESQIIVGDLLDEVSLENIPKNIEAAYYLVHSMGNAHTDFRELEELSASNFVKALEKIGVIAKVRRSRGKDIDAACGQLANKT